MSVEADGAVPVTVLTGFLGAGKTTLLNGLLRHPAMADAAVLVNEFGEIGIDHRLVDRVEGDMLMLSTGCLCCAARGDLVTALASLLARRASGAVTFTRILVETTGLADPGPVLNALLPSAALGDGCRFDRLVTVVDGEAVGETLSRAGEARRQIAMADLLVLSKLDRLPPDDPTVIPALQSLVRDLNPVAPILRAADLDSVLAGAPGADVAEMRDASLRPRPPPRGDRDHRPAGRPDRGSGVRAFPRPSVGPPRRRSAAAEGVRRDGR